MAAAAVATEVAATQIRLHILLLFIVTSLAEWDRIRAALPRPRRAKALAIGNSRVDEP